jgi:glycine cleavage system H protein
MSYPTNYRYTKSHEWLSIDGTTGTVGITDYAQNQLGDIVFVELPKVGDKFEADQSYGTVESVKAVSELFAPAAGTVTEINQELNDAPEDLNEEANQTWIIKLKLTGSNPGKDLLSAADYEKFIAEESGH